MHEKSFHLIQGTNVKMYCIICISMKQIWGGGGAVVTPLPLTFEVNGSNPRSHVGRLVIAYRWLAVDSTESWPQNNPSWYDLYSTVLKATQNPK